MLLWQDVFGNCRDKTLVRGVSRAPGSVCACSSPELVPGLPGLDQLRHDAINSSGDP